uniref:AlNc14C82G5350 protein n=1 Tax=Albugo laibachii Nc14 TaxID=890382 RepID=F0WFG1_9STRA|nr:AlNc14C82G5350 [Albugo laibachii Nc14]|eukprot:CCA19943.1 AlNc14C82G5350 [Albugo laibachii Nc14]
MEVARPGHLGCADGFSLLKWCRYREVHIAEILAWDSGQTSIGCYLHYIEEAYVLYCSAYQIIGSTFQAAQSDTMKKFPCRQPAPLDEIILVLFYNVLNAYILKESTLKALATVFGRWATIGCSNRVSHWLEFYP